MDDERNLYTEETDAVDANSNGGESGDDFSGFEKVEAEDVANGTADANQQNDYESNAYEQNPYQQNAYEQQENPYQQNGYQQYNQYGQYQQQTPYGSPHQSGQPYGPTGKKIGTGFGIASLVLGIISLVLFCTCLNVVTAILAIIFGIIQIVSYEKKGMAIAGIITSGLSILFCAIFWVAIFGNADFQRMMDDPNSIQDYLEEYMNEQGIDAIPYQFNPSDGNDDMDDFDIDEYDFDLDDFEPDDDTTWIFNGKPAGFKTMPFTDGETPNAEENVATGEHHGFIYCY